MFLFNDTRLRKKLLTYSFNNPDKDCYLRELSKLISEDPGNLSRELAKLQKEGLYTVTVRGKMKFYSLNKHYPHYNELKTIIGKSDTVEEALRNLIESYNGIKIAFIHGTYVKDNKTPTINLIIAGTFPAIEITDKLRSIAIKSKRKIHLTSYSDDEFTQQRKATGSPLNTAFNDRVIMLKLPL
jgi:predicted transcriptional regulator with HTH domain